MAYASIIGNGKLQDSVVGELEAGEIIVCADGGANNLMNYGIVPDIVIGDMDSIRTDVVERLKRVEGVEFIEYPPEKDFSDMELAVEKCVAIGYDDIRMFGSTGWRLDHTIANITLAFRKPSIHITVVDAKNRIIPAKTGITELNSMKGRNVSVVALSQKLIYTTRGMKYPADQLELKSGAARGIDNTITESEASIEVHAGRGLILFSED